MGFLAGMGLRLQPIARQTGMLPLPLPIKCMGLMGLMGLVVDAVEIDSLLGDGAIISNSSYGERVGNCSLESGATLTAMETSATLRAAISATSRARITFAHPMRDETVTRWGVPASHCSQCSHGQRIYYQKL